MADSQTTLRCEANAGYCLHSGHQCEEAGRCLFKRTPGLFSEVSSSVDGEVLLADGMDIIATIAPGSAAVIVTDPPYGIAYHSNYYKDKNPHAPIAQDWDFQIGAYLQHAAAALREGGAIYLFTRFDVMPLWTREIPHGLALKNAIIWKKDNWSSGDLTGNFGFQYEILLFITKGRHVIRGKRWPNIWEFARIPSKRLRMPAEKPLGIYTRSIEASSDPGDLVVDTFCGSGTAAEAAMKTGRRFLVCDVDKKMVRMTRERIGLPVGADEASLPIVSPCPVFHVQPPSPSLWGLHPEDVADWLSCSPESVDA